MKCIDAALTRFNTVPNRRVEPDLSIIAPGRCAARTPGTGPLHRSSGAGPEKGDCG
jgi:hypothetical protein